MDDDMLRKMRARVEQCRRLASSTTDERAAKALSKMADEVEADLRRLKAAAKQDT
jgi:hypothetical protein